jgi:hypothetical protein
VRRSVAISIVTTAIALVVSLGAAAVQADTAAPTPGPDDTLKVTSTHYVVKHPGGNVRDRSGPGCGGKQGYWKASGGGKFVFHDAEARGYGALSVSMFGGPSNPGADDQGALTVYYGATYNAGTGWTAAKSTTVMTGPDTSDHTTTTPTVPIGVVQDYDTHTAVPGFAWTFTTRDGASYDVASYTFNYTVLTPQS